MFAVIKKELSGKTVYGPVLNTTQLSAHAQNQASPERCRDAVYTSCLPAVVEDVDDGERGRLPVPHLAHHLSERHRRPQHSSDDAHVLRHAVLHQQPAALEHSRITAVRLMARRALCDKAVSRAIQAQTDYCMYTAIVSKCCDSVMMQRS